MKFKVDENLPEELVDLFRASGFDASSVVQQNLGGAIDPQVADVCLAEERILVTFDRGFANVRIYPPSSMPGIILFRLKRQDKAHVLAVSVSVIEMLRRHGMGSDLWIVHENRIRMRDRT